MARPKKEEKIEIKEKVVEKKFSKEAILKSRKFIDKKTLLKVLLKENEMYSISETNKIVDEYLNKEVK